MDWPTLAGIEAAAPIVHNRGTFAVSVRDR